MHLMDLIGCIDQREHSNEAMVRRLQGDGTLSSAHIARALLAVDRGEYVGTERADLNYSDMPVKLGVVHLSAPSIYASALEALDVREGHSFLHLGSGTGYLSTVVALLAGPHTVNHGVEAQPELVDLARSLAARRSADHLEFFCANAYQLAVHASMAYDRVYISAAAPREARALFRLLRVGGVLVGPFDADDDEPYGGGHQYLVKVVRTSEDGFSVSRLQPVQFAPLRHPGSGALKALPPLALQPLAWSCETHARFPPRFRAAVRCVLWAGSQRECALSALPAELLLRVLGSLPFYAFEPSAQPGGAEAGRAGRQQGGASSAAEGSTAASAAAEPEPEAEAEAVRRAAPRRAAPESARAAPPRGGSAGG